MRQVISSCEICGKPIIFEDNFLEKALYSTYLLEQQVFCCPECKRITEGFNEEVERKYNKKKRRDWVNKTLRTPMATIVLFAIGWAVGTGLVLDFSDNENPRSDVGLKVEEGYKATSDYESLIFDGNSWTRSSEGTIAATTEATGRAASREWYVQEFFFYGLIRDVNRMSEHAAMARGCHWGVSCWKNSDEENRIDCRCYSRLYIEE